MKKIIILILILGQFLMAAQIEYIKANGFKIPVIFESDKRLPLINMQFVFQNSGSITDTKISGFAKFSAKMMGEGTKKLGSHAFAELLEARAIHISASAGRETFVMDMSCLSDEFDEALSYFDALLKDPNITEKTLTKVQTTLVGKLSSKKNDYDYVAGNELKSILFEGTPLSNPASGTIQSVKTIKLDDVQKFIDENLVSSKLIVVIGGDIDKEDVKQKLQLLISYMPKGKLESLKNYKLRQKPKEVVLKRETEQAYLYFGSPYNMGISSDDVYKSRVAAFILGAGGFGSRLMEEVRVKKGLAYSAYARFNVNKSSSYMSGYLQTKLESLDEAKKTVQEVMAEFVQNGVTEEELEQTKKFLLGSEPLRVETISQRLSRTFQEYYRGDEFGSSAKELEKIKALKLEDLNKFIKKHKEILDISFAIVTK
ncbi:MAG: insulinase family protein [Sulfurimonas sp.]|nr:insulinase family protein [Sulfurimonas sp.]